jgi:hypothetical protein
MSSVAATGTAVASAALATRRASGMISPTPVAPAASPAPAASSGGANCVARVAASVKYPRLGVGTQTLYVVARNAGGAPVAGATGWAHVQYQTTSRAVPLPATDQSGEAAASWPVLGQGGEITVSIVEAAGGCTAIGAANFQGEG